MFSLSVIYNDRFLLLGFLVLVVEKMQRKKPLSCGFDFFRDSDNED